MIEKDVMSEEENRNEEGVSMNVVSSPSGSSPGTEHTAAEGAEEGDVPTALKFKIEQRIHEGWDHLGRKTKKAIIASVVGVVMLIVIGIAGLAATGLIFSSTSTVKVANSILLRGGIVVNHDSAAYIRDVLIGNGVITLISAGNGKIPNSMLPDGTTIIDCSGKYVFPGGIDPHTHLAMPFMGTVAIDDWETGSRAAVAGGTTTVLDFVMSSKSYGGLVASVDKWLSAAASTGTTLCNYGLHLALGYWDADASAELDAVVAKGVSSIKHFMAYKGGLMLTDDQILASFKRGKELGVLEMVHAEDGETVYANQVRLATVNKMGPYPMAHALSRLPEVETVAVERAIKLAKSAGVPLVVVHTSASGSASAIKKAQKAGQNVYGEVLAIHLTLDDSRYLLNNSATDSVETAWNKAAAHVLSPPLRNKTHVSAMWDAVVDGTISMVGTDHCAFNTAQKRAGRTDFRSIPNGVPGLEERLYLLWDQGVNTGRLTVQQFVALTSANTAMTYNLYPTRGRIATNSVADIVVWDPSANHTFSAKTHFSNTEIDVLEGTTVKGSPVVTLVNGQVVFQDGKIVASKATGSFIPRAAFGTPYPSSN